MLETILHFFDATNLPSRVSAANPLPTTSAGGAGSVVGAGTQATAQRITQASDSPEIVALGTPADAAATDSTSSWSLIALFKGVMAQLLSTAPAQIYRADSYLNITGDATTVVKSGAGTLSRIVLNAPTATEVITIYDNTAASGTIIGKITIPTSPQPVSIEFGVAFATGLTILTATATSDLTIVYR